MPFPSEHAARQHDPGNYKSFARKAFAGVPGVDAIYGIRKSDGKSEVQTLRFDKTKWTVVAAKKWLREHGFKSDVEAASGKTKSSLDVGVNAVHVAATIGEPVKAKAMAKLNAAQRNKLMPSQFADPANRKYPIHDKAHADKAMSRLEGEKDTLAPRKYRMIRDRIRAAQRRFGEEPKDLSAANKAGAFKLRLTHPDGSRTLVHHQMAAMYDESTNGLYTYFPLDKGQALSAGDADGRVWIQIARTGAWAGHPQGAFALTDEILDQLAANFYGQGVGRIQWDFNHASAFPANSGSIPVTGTPAQGWAYGFKREGHNFYALTQWLPLAKEYIQNDQYGGASPLINWKAVDRVSGRPIGAELRSIALTNLPFLLDMARPIAASADGLPTEPRGLMALTEIEPAADQQLSAFCYMSTATMLPKLKQAFGLHELVGAQHVRDALSNLCGHLDAVDGDATASHEGIDLSGYVAKLRELFGDTAEMSSTELIQFIDKLLDEYMAENDIEDSDMSANSASALPAEATNPNDPLAATAASKEGAPVAEPVIASAPVAAAATPEVYPTSDPTTVVTTPSVTAASAVAETALPDPQVSALTLQLAEANAKNAALETQVSALEAKLNGVDAQSLSAEVDAAFVTYKDTKGLKEENKAHMLSMLTATPEAFRAMYPPVEHENRHLLAHLTGGGAADPHAPGTRVEADTAAEINPENKPNEYEQILALGLNGLTDKLMANSQGQLSLLAATTKADAMIREARKAVNQAKGN